jgi:hypothetical protein
MNGALGFSLHTGWAAAVVVIRDGRKIEVVSRRRLELLPSETAIPRFVYHRAAEVCAETGLDEAAALVESARAVAGRTAQQAIQELLHSIRAEIRVAGIPSSGPKADDRNRSSAPLAKILASHAMIHAAEGRLFQQAVFAGCQSCGVTPVVIHNRDVWPKAAELCGMNEKQLRQTVDAIGKEIGPPWTVDQKLATAAALTAAAAKQGTRGPV